MSSLNTSELLKKYFNRKKKSNPGFGLAQLAETTKISPSFLSRMLNGKKAVPYAALMKICRALEIESEVSKQILESHHASISDGVYVQRGKNNVRSELSEFQLAQKSDFKILRNWYYLPILDMLTLSNFDGTLNSLSQRLNISLPTIEVAVREMVSAGLIEVEGGKFKKASEKLRWSSSTSKEEIRKFHSSILDVAKTKLRDEISDDQFLKRLITTLSFGVSSSRIEEAKSRLSEFIHALANELASDPGEQVYILAAQLFPVSKD